MVFLTTSKCEWNHVYVHTSSKQSCSSPLLFLSSHCHPTGTTIWSHHPQLIPQLDHIIHSWYHNFITLSTADTTTWSHHLQLIPQLYNIIHSWYHNLITSSACLHKDNSRPCHSDQSIQSIWWGNHYIQQLEWLTEHFTPLTPLNKKIK